MKLIKLIIAIIAFYAFASIIIFGYEPLTAEQLTHLKKTIQDISKDKDGKDGLIQLYGWLGQTKLVLLGTWHENPTEEPVFDVSTRNDINKYINKLKATGMTPSKLGPQLYQALTSAFPVPTMEALGLKKHFESKQFEQSTLDDYGNLIYDILQDIEKIRRIIDAQGIITRK